LADCRIYLITPPIVDPAAFAPVLASALDAGDCACLLLRTGDVSDDAVLRAAEILRPIAQSRDVAILLNDRPDLARRADCDGVHIDRGDGRIKAARATIGNNAILGVACRDSRHLAMEAGEAGADYVAFGAFFPTESEEISAHADIDLLSWWSEMMEVPCVATGGVTPANCGELVRAGADFVAVGASVWNHPTDPASAVRDFIRAIEEA